MQISSSAFNHNENIPSKYTCDGENVNPPLTFSGIPESTVNLALLVDDPDAPAGDWVHWLIMDMDPNTTEIAENSIPNGVSATTSFGNTSYGGPCPPSGTHRYFFKLFALDTKLNLYTTATKADFLEASRGHILDQTDIVGLYSRN